MRDNPLKIQKLLVAVTVILFIIKIVAYVLTNSLAILTDALEFTVNVVAGFLGLYSLSLSAKPKDNEHPYGHGKVEFLTSAIEGVLIIVAGFIVIYEAIMSFIHPHELKQLDYGLILFTATGIINYFVGYYCVKKGKQSNSPVLIAGGSHLISDTYATLGLLIGVLIVYFTHIKMIDSIVAIIFAFIIIFTGYKILRKSISGIMDEKDNEIIDEIVTVLNENRNPNWIDVHNMRVINYAGFYHIDCHLTVPYYINVHEAHLVLDSLTDLIKVHFQDRVEFFIHIDGCLEFQCKLCEVPQCKFRQDEFEKHVAWTHDNIISNQKHRL